MSKKKKTTESTEITEVGFEGLIGLFEQTQTTMQTQAARSVDIALVVRNWLFGWYIVEFEKAGDIAVTVPVDLQRKPDHGSMGHGSMGHGTMQKQSD